MKEGRVHLRKDTQSGLAWRFFPIDLISKQGFVILTDANRAVDESLRSILDRPTIVESKRKYHDSLNVMLGCDSTWLDCHSSVGMSNEVMHIHSLLRSYHTCTIWSVWVVRVDNETSLRFAASAWHSLSSTKKAISLLSKPYLS